MMTDEKLPNKQYYPLSLQDFNRVDQLFLMLLAGVAYSFFIQSFTLAIEFIAMFAGILYISHQPSFTLKSYHPSTSSYSKKSVSAPPPPKNDPEELESFKQQMIHMLIHDLKTPLSNILSLSEQGKSGSNLERIHQSGTQMLDLIMNILEAEKLEEAQLPVNKNAQSSDQLIDGATAQVVGWAQAKNIQIKQANHSLQVVADDHLTKRVLTNLLSNAIKYSPQNSQVLINTEQLNAHTVRFSVSDQGCGITTKAQKRIFDKFYQAHRPAQSNNAYSTGIGLNFCKLAIEAQGGTIGVQSTTDKGSTFWFTLPISKKAQSNNQTSNLRQTYTACAPCDSYLSLQDKDKLMPWLIKLRKYEVYQLSKIKAVLNTMTFEQGGNYSRWKQKVEQAIYASNEEQYQWLIK